MLHPFLLFVYEDHYPLGGWRDYKGDFETLSEAEQDVRSLGEGWFYQVVDTRSGVVVAGDDRD